MPQEMIKTFFNCLPNYCTRCGAWHDDGTVDLCMNCLDKEDDSYIEVQNYEKEGEINV